MGIRATRTLGRASLIVPSCFNFIFTKYFLMQKKRPASFEAGLGDKSKILNLWTIRSENRIMTRCDTAQHSSVCKTNFGLDNN
jgi:hypothetical protein